MSDLIHIKDNLFGEVDAAGNVVRKFALKAKTLEEARAEVPNVKRQVTMAGRFKATPEVVRQVADKRIAQTVSLQQQIADLQTELDASAELAAGATLNKARQAEVDAARARRQEVMRLRRRGEQLAKAPPIEDNLENDALWRSGGE